MAASPAAAVARRVKSDRPARKSRTRKKPKTPRTYKPDGMTLEQWQIALRREFGREQRFKLRRPDDSGDDAGEVFGDWLVTNPQTQRTYRVSVRGRNPGDNFCTCPDFSVNTLGTCKHIEFTLGRLERRPGAKAALTRGYQPPFSEVYLRYGLRREVGLRRGADCPADLDARAGRFLDERDILRPELFDRFDELVTELSRGGHDVRLHDDAVAFVAQSRDTAHLRRRIDELFPQGIDSPAFDGLVNAKLYPYQRRGALFAASAGRCLLADDMGLGKTLQAITATEILALAAGVERVLIVCPTSLKHQWKQEIERFTPSRGVVVAEGMSTARRAAFARESFYKVTNYEALHRDLEAVNEWSPDLVILDEAQRIKNWKTRNARTVKQLATQHAIVLTGTPLENRLEELHSIVEFVDRYRLGPAFRFLAEHQKLDADGRVVGFQNLSAIGQTLAPILLRRTKAEVLTELPGRLEKHLFLPMTPQQRQHHEENREIVARIVSKWRKHRFLSEADQKRMQMALQNMRMACNSTYLLDPQTEYGSKPDELIDQLCEHLESPDSKVVVFSQWLRSHELLSRRLEKRREQFVLFHGGIPGPKRKDLIARFKQEAKCRVFLSTDAGGVGLNLQNASAVFIMDQPWNPAVLEQRIGRVHRLGQTRPVHVVHFVSQDSIEHGMLDVLRFKKSLFAGVLDGGHDEVFMGGTRLTKFMESVDAVTRTDGERRAVSVPTPQATPGDDGTVAARPAPERAGASSPAARGERPATAGELLGELVTLGRSLFDNLARVLAPSVDSGGGAGRGGVGPAWQVARDAQTGESYLRVPVPSEDVLGRAVMMLQALTGFSQIKGDSPGRAAPALPAR